MKFVLLLLLCAWASDLATRRPTNFSLSVFWNALASEAPDKLKFVGQAPEQAAMTAYRKASTLFEQQQYEHGRVKNRAREIDVR